MVQDFILKFTSKWKFCHPNVASNLYEFSLVDGTQKETLRRMFMLLSSIQFHTLIHA